MVENTSIKFCESNKEFWMNMYDNLSNPELKNGVRAGDRSISFDWLQKQVVNFFKNNNDIYKQMLFSITKEKDKNGN